jgi:hypothetical protein
VELFTGLSLILKDSPQESFGPVESPVGPASKFRLAVGTPNVGRIFFVGAELYPHACMQFGQYRTSGTALNTIGFVIQSYFNTCYVENFAGVAKSFNFVVCIKKLKTNAGDFKILWDCGLYVLL